MSDEIGILAQNELIQRFQGELYFDDMMKILYSTDASAYRELPYAVAIPANKNDIKLLINFASANKLSLIPRSAGTSLAGQVVGSGIIVDTSKYFNRILELNKEEKWVIVEPGVVPDELNKYLAKHGLFWGPETSTSNRCKIGGMLGNNSCGSHSLIYGSTRDHTLSVKAILSNGSETEFKSLNQKEYDAKLKLDNLEGNIYRFTNSLLDNEDFRKEIELQYPDKSIKRRNTGYALDILCDLQPFNKAGEPFNMAKLLAGSEGTLAFTTEIKLNLVDLPPKNKALVCVHLYTIEEALRANLVALKYKPSAVELMDKTVMDLTKENREQNKNRFFVKGDPGAILIVEFIENDREIITDKWEKMKAEMLSEGYGYHFPLVEGKDIPKVWTLRKAGLGVLSNMPGDNKPVPVIEDTAVKPADMPEYIREFDLILKKNNLSCIYYAHIGSGELHLRPVLNLKDPDHVKLFREIAYESARLVKKYRGSLSGEHGDGRLRGEFIPLMIGDIIYKSFIDLKNVWDPHNIMNPGKIVNTPPMDSSLRFTTNRQKNIPKTYFDFSKDKGMLAAAEKCSGSGDCIKSSVMGGTMCPSYMATKDEKNSTRARANILREYLTYSEKPNPLNQNEIFEVLKLCLSCKACKSECPSNVDITKLKAEFLQHYYDSSGTPLRVLLIGHFPVIYKLLSVFPRISNSFLSANITSGIIKKFMGFSANRNIPQLANKSLASLINKSSPNQNNYPNGTVYLYNDEFTNYQDSDIGIKAIFLLNALGYHVKITRQFSSGRTYLSKGLLKKSAKIAARNVTYVNSILSDNNKLVGIEPSAIYSFRDEYPELVNDDLKADAIKIAENCLTIDEFIYAEAEKGIIKSDRFTKNSEKILVHGHCHQKAIGSVSSVLKMLSLPENYDVSEIPSGCCGMAGSFGYEKENYELSMKIGEMVLFPAVRESGDNIIIAASGTSCRCQIADGTGRKARHPVEILLDAII